MQQRAKIHFQPPKGWINDPNGLIFFGGQYHAFFQYNPDDMFSRKIRWGHIVSDDLLHWRQLPSAIYPDEDYDETGCWSGSALEKDGKMYLFYTSVSEKYGQTQSVAVSDDGVNFIKYDGNPVIKKPPFPTRDFRDPKVTKTDDGYAMVLGSGEGGEGKILLYKSDDLLEWRYEGVLFEKKALAKVFECPDFFRLGDKYVLMFSKIAQNINAAYFATGVFDGRKFTPQSFCEPVYGPQFFAAQTFEDDKNRRILIAWMSDWTRKPAPDDEFIGSLSIPMRVSLKDGKIFLYPVEEARGFLATGNAAVRVEGNDIIVDGQPPVKCPVAISKIEFLSDANLLEIFVNDGEFVMSYVL